MIIIVCLGNPGEKYHYTRHNIGFRIGDALLSESILIDEKTKFNCKLNSVLFNEHKIMIVYPLTYMNNSGVAIQKFCNFYKIDFKKLFMIYDDFDIPFGSLRVKKEGSAGTHNGCKSIIQHLNATCIPRLRVGIGPLLENQTISDFVLSNFSNAEETHINKVIAEAIKTIQIYITCDINAAMQHCNNKRFL